MGGAEDDDARLPPGPGVDPVSGRVTFVVDAEPGRPAAAGLVPPARVRRGPDLPPPRRAVGRHHPGPAGRPARVPARRPPRTAPRRWSLDPANPRTGRGRVRRPLGARAARLPRAGLARRTSPPWSSQPVRTRHVRRRSRASCAHAAGARRRRAAAAARRPRRTRVRPPGPAAATTSAWLAARDPALRCRVLLLQPGDRDLDVRREPALRAGAGRGRAPARSATSLPTVGRPVGLGASLGALSLLHAAATWPGTFGGLFLPVGLVLPAPLRRPRAAVRATTTGSSTPSRRSTATPAGWPGWRSR